MTASSTLTAANLRSFVRDRAALFWTLFFPVIFVILFGLDLLGRRQSKLTLGWVDERRPPAVAGLRAALAAASGADV